MTDNAINGILILLVLYVTIIYVLLPFVGNEYGPDIIRFLHRRIRVWAPIVALFFLELVAIVGSFVLSGTVVDVVESALLVASLLIGVGFLFTLWTQALDPYILATWLLRAKKSDTFAGLLSSTLDNNNFTHAQALLRALRDRSLRIRHWTEDDTEILTSTGHTLWYRGEPPGSDPRISPHINQLHDLRSMFIGDIKRLWLAIAKLRDEHAADLLSLALSQLVTDIPDDGIVSVLQDVIYDDAEHPLLSAYVFEEFACAIGSARTHLLSRERSPEVSNNWLNELALQAAVLRDRKGHDESCIARMLGNAYMVSPDTDTFEVTPIREVPLTHYKAVARVMKDRGDRLRVRELPESGDIPPRSHTVRPN